ncbi:MAG: metallophosphoesterase [bacterium]
MCRKQLPSFPMAGLVLALGVAACGSGSGGASGDGPEGEGAAPGFEFVQLSDVHVGRSPPQEQENLRRAVDQVNAMLPAFVLLTGDLTNNGGLEEYAVLKDILSELTVPYYCVPGDNDIVDGEGDVGRYREQLGAECYSFTYRGYRIIGVDNNAEIALDQGQREWFERELQIGGAEIVFAHKALLDGSAGFEALPTAGPLLELLDAYGVVAFLSGHEHESAEVRWGDTQHVWCDNLSFFHTGIETYNLFQVDAGEVRLSHVHWDGSRELVVSFPAGGDSRP